MTGRGSIVLAVMGSADVESMPDIMSKGTALLTFERVGVLEVDLRAATHIDGPAALQFATLMRQARKCGRELRFRAVPSHLSDTVETIVRNGTQ